MIELKALSFGYHKNEPLFHNLNLTIKQGGICGLLGKNGAGKTTLLKIMAGLIFPDQGNCEVMSHMPKRREPDFLQEIYILPEDLYVPALTVDNFIKAYAPFYPRFDLALLQNNLNEFELPKNKLLTTFSYGQKKKFLIAFGLATGCRLFILDEPTNGLDIPSKAQFRKLLAATVTDEKLFIISTHQVRDVENLIDSIVVLDNGNIIFNQSMVDIVNQLAFVQQATEPEPDACFYSEKNLNGFSSVVMNKEGQDTQVDLEILFNAILLNKEKLQKLFQREQV